MYYPKSNSYVLAFSPNTHPPFLLDFTVADDFFSSMKTASGRANFALPTWLVQLEGSGTRKVYRYDNGFQYLSFPNVQCELHTRNGDHLSETDMSVN